MLKINMKVIFAMGGHCTASNSGRVRQPLPEIRDKMAVARAHQGHNGCEFV